MSKDTEISNNDPELVTGELDRTPSELETLKARATLLNITYHPSIGVDKLRAKIAETQTPVVSPPVSDFITHKEYTKTTNKDRKRKAAELVRVNVVCMNPERKDWEGEIISVGSAKLGTFKKFVPFNTTEGWHIPHIMLTAMQERKCSIFVTVKDHLGNKVRKAKQVSEFNIQILPPLTKVELKELAQRQAMSGSIEQEV